MPKRQFRVDPAAAQAERRELVKKLERGFQQVQESDEYRSYLDTVSRFHKYSVSNTMLIWVQCPNAAHVAGFHTWLSLGRHVRKGEKGIRIFAPMPYRKIVSTFDEGTEEFEEHEIGQIRFRAVSVFDISQTDGADLAEPPVTLLSGDDVGLWQTLAAVAQTERLTIDRKPGRGGAGGANGWYDRIGREVWIDPDLEPVMAAKTLCHEIAHHHAEHIDSRQEHETIAESVAYIVLGHFGIDAGDYSFGYLASWSDLATFRGKLADIQTIASQIIECVEGRNSQRAPGGVNAYKRGETWKADLKGKIDNEGAHPGRSKRTSASSLSPTSAKSRRGHHASHLARMSAPALLSARQRQRTG